MPPAATNARAPTAPVRPPRPRTQARTAAPGTRPRHRSARDVRSRYRAPRSPSAQLLLSLVREARDEIAPRRPGVRRRRASASRCIRTSRASAAPPVSRGGCRAPPTAAQIEMLPIAVLQPAWPARADDPSRGRARDARSGARRTADVGARRRGALFLAMPTAARQDASRARSCPTDAELLRPVSAGAQRDAYARAEACFARAHRVGQDVGRGARERLALSRTARRSA